MGDATFSLTGMLQVFAVVFGGYIAVCMFKGIIDAFREAADSRSPGVRRVPIGSQLFPGSPDRTEAPSAFVPSEVDRHWLRRNGWRFESPCILRGRFRTRFLTIPGKVTYSPDEREFHVLLLRPPDWILNGSHGACLWDRGNGWFLLHQNDTKASFVETIISTEAFILRSFEQAHGRDEQHHRLPPPLPALAAPRRRAPRARR